jgi:RimJ/RimL family protein N-acetyltransferase
VRTNELGQPVGDPVRGWQPRPPARPKRLDGRHCTLHRLAESHLPALYEALVVHGRPELWTYLARGPFSSRAEFDDYVESFRGQAGAWPMVVTVDDVPTGIACYLRTDPANGSVEVGSITWSPALQRTAAATETMYLMARHAFEELGYRRFEWKCDALNAASRTAAVRFGFTAEGVFRNAVVYKGRNRDTAWFSITDAQWRLLRPAYDTWLAPENFDDHGVQRSSLSELTGAALRR